jgi:transketolase
VLRYRVDDLRWDGRDRFLLSKGHGCIAQYVLLADKGFIGRDELRSFCRAGSRLGGHPEAGKVPGVEASTGALGHGLPIAVGMALGLRLKRLSSRVFVVCGDGEINEGSVWEAAMHAAKHRLDNLVVMIDYNKIQSAGFTRDILELEPLLDKWRAFGFATTEVDGHDVAQLRRVLAGVPLERSRPSAVICHTIKGRGIPACENDPEWHHKSSLNNESVASLRAELRRAASDA